MNTQSFTQVVSTMVTAIQGRAAQLLDLTVGSILRVLTESFAAQLMWLQALIMTVLATTRASTSNGADLDSWMADYGLTRLPAVAATGLVTLARYTDSAAAYISPTATLNSDGSVSGTAAVESSDGSQQYGITTDTTNSFWNAGLGQYVIPANTPSIAVPVAALTAGAAGNAVAGSINTLAAALPGIDTVTNTATLTNGADAEADADFRARFLLYIASLPRATVAAIAEAVASVQEGVAYAITENTDWLTGVAAPGQFYVVVDDGSGAPATPFIMAMAAAVEAVRPLAVQAAVYGPVLQQADVTMTIALAPGYDAVATSTAVQTALNAYISGLGLGNGLPFTRLAQVAYDASSGVSNVTGVVLNGATDDVLASAKVTIKPGAITVGVAS